MKKPLFIGLFVLQSLFCFAQYPWDNLKEDAEDAPLKEILTVNYSQYRTPSQALLRKLLAETRTNSMVVLDKKDPANRTKLDQALSTQNDEKLATLASYLMINGYATPAVYVYAGILPNKLQDSIVAQNLGVCLKSISQPKYAYQILLYAASLTHMNANIQSSLGWVATSAGDFKTGKTHFEKALAYNSESVSALKGLAAIYMARGLPMQALPYLELAMKKRFTFGGAVQKKQQQQELVDEIAKREAVVTESTPLPPVDAILPITEYEDRPVGGNAVSPFNIPIAPIEFNPILDVAIQNAPIIDAYYQKLVESNQETLGKTMTEILQLEEQWKVYSEPKTVGNIITIPYPYTRQLAALDYYEKLFARRMLAFEIRFLSAIRFRRQTLVEVMGGFKKTYERDAVACGNASDCLERVDARYCNAKMPAMRNFHQFFYGAWQQKWNSIQQDIQTYLTKTAFYVQSIRNPTLNALVNKRRTACANMLLQYAVDAAAWQTWIPDASLAACEERAVIEPEVAERKATEIKGRQTLAAFAEPNGNCALPTWNIDAGIFETEATCEKLNFTFGELGVIGAELRWGKDWGSDEIDIFAGLKLETDGSVKVGGKLLEYVTITGDKGVVDVGIKGEVVMSGSGVGAAERTGGRMSKIGAKLEGKAEFTISHAKGGSTGLVAPEWKALVE